jgi:hypothetical protein
MLVHADFKHVLVNTMGNSREAATTTPQRPLVVRRGAR